MSALQAKLKKNQQAKQPAPEVKKDTTEKEKVVEEKKPDITSQEKEKQQDTPAPSGLGTNSLEPTDKHTPSVPNEVVDYKKESPSKGDVDYDAEVTVTAGDLLDMHRMLSYCLRGNQRPAVLKVQQKLASLLPEGTPVIYREPV